MLPKVCKCCGGRFESVLGMDEDLPHVCPQCVEEQRERSAETELTERPRAEPVKNSMTGSSGVTGSSGGDPV